MNHRQFTPSYQFLLLAVLSVAVMIVDHRGELLQPLRTALSAATIPLQQLAALPRKLNRVLVFRPADSERERQIRKLRKENMLLLARLQRMETLEAENARLSRLLTVSKRAGDEALLATIQPMGLEPFTHRVVVNRGREAGVYSGQPAIDSKGVLGQVTETTLFRSVITLMTDPGHAIPVQVQRNGLRTIVQGLGVEDRVSVPFLPRRADIRGGDVLVTSGIGGRFPVGYRVARVVEVIKDANEPFLRIHAEPIARIEQVKEVLLVWTGLRPAPEQMPDDFSGLEFGAPE